MLSSDEVLDVDVEFVIKHMREEDRNEVAAIGHSPRGALNESIAMSRWCYVAYSSNGFPLFIAGLSATGATPWLLGTLWIDLYPKQFFRETKALLQRMLAEEPSLANVTHADNVRSHRWLERLGFTVHTDRPIHIYSTRETFYWFHITTDKTES